MKFSLYLICRGAYIWGLAYIQREICVSDSGGLYSGWLIFRGIILGTLGYQKLWYNEKTWITYLASSIRHDQKGFAKERHFLTTVIKLNIQIKIVVTNSYTPSLFQLNDNLSIKVVILVFKELMYWISLRALQC